MMQSYVESVGTQREEYEIGAMSLTRMETSLAAIASSPPFARTQTTTVYTPGPSGNGTAKAKLPSSAT